MAVADVTPGTRFELGILRNGHAQNMNLTVGEYHGDGQIASNAEGDSAAPGQGGKLGLAMPT